MERKPLAREYLNLYDVWNHTSKETIAVNTIAALRERFPECSTFSGQQDKLSEITKSNKHTTYAWTNLSRSDVKIPLLKLCMLADALDIEVMEFLK